MNKRRFKNIVRKALAESAFHDEGLAEMAEEYGIYYKDWYDVPGICENALMEGFISIGLVDEAAEHLKGLGLIEVEDVIEDWENSSRLAYSTGPLREVSQGVAKYRKSKGNRWPLATGSAAASSLACMIAWIVAR